MKNSEYGGSQAILMAFTTVIGGCSLLIFPNLFPGFWKTIAWSIIALSAVLAIILYQKDQKQKEIQEKELEQARKRRSLNKKAEKRKQDAHLEASRQKLERKDERAAEKIVIQREEIAKEAQEVWGGRISHAEERQNFFKAVIAKTNQMPVRTAAGKAAFEWNEAFGIAQWTMEQVAMFVQRPSVTTKAREEAREAVLESIMIKATGGNWTKEQGEKLANKKEDAKQELQIEEKRIEAMKNELDNAGIKWRAAEMRANRWQDELEKLTKASSK
ncbi:MAG: hypothetical protein AAF549_01450 [Pseudomonadota bacterium]